MAVPAVSGAGFIVVEAEFGLGGLEAVLDRPAPPFDSNQRLDAGPCRAPRGEVGAVAPSPADRRFQAEESNSFAMSSAVLDTSGLPIQEWKVYPPETNSLSEAAG